MKIFRQVETNFLHMFWRVFQILCWREGQREINRHKRLVDEDEVIEELGEEERKRMEPFHKNIKQKWINKNGNINMFTLSKEWPVE